MAQGPGGELSAGSPDRQSALRIGQISSGDNGVVTGRLGDTMNVVQGGNAAELAAVNVLAQIVHNGGVELDSRSSGWSSSPCSSPRRRIRRAAPRRQWRLEPDRRGAGRQGQARTCRRSGWRRCRSALAVEIEAVVEVLMRKAPLRPSDRPSRPARPRRGASSRTRARAFQRAIDKGYAIECDLQLTRDGVPVVFHDDDLDRLTGLTGHVSARSHRTSC